MDIGDSIGGDFLPTSDIGGDSAFSGNDSPLKASSTSVSNDGEGRSADSGSIFNSIGDISSGGVDYGSLISSVSDLEGGILGELQKEFMRNLEAQILQAQLANTFSRAKNIASSFVY